MQGGQDSPRHVLSMFHVSCACACACKTYHGTCAKTMSQGVVVRSTEARSFTSQPYWLELGLESASAIIEALGS